MSYFSALKEMSVTDGEDVALPMEGLTCHLASLWGLYRNHFRIEGSPVHEAVSVMLSEVASMPNILVAFDLACSESVLLLVDRL